MGTALALTMLASSISMPVSAQGLQESVTEIPDVMSSEISIDEPASEDLGIESPDAFIEVGGNIRTPRVLIGATLFSITTNKLANGDLVTTQRTGKLIPKQKRQFGIYGQFNGKTKVGVGYYPPFTGTFLSTGSVTISNTNGNTEFYIIQTNAESTAGDRYAFAQGAEKNKETSGTALFTAIA